MTISHGYIGFGRISFYLELDSLSWLSYKEHVIDKKREGEKSFVLHVVVNLTQIMHDQEIVVLVD